MDTSGDAAEKIVKMSLDGVEVAAKITGDTAEHFANILIKAMRDHKQTSGKASLTTMLKTGKPIKVFSIRDNELKKFCQEAKKYGVLYHVLKDRDSKDGKCDIMVREEDAGKVNRIFERFRLGIDNKENIKDAVEDAMSERAQEKTTSETVNAQEEKTEAENNTEVKETSDEKKEATKETQEEFFDDYVEEEKLPSEDEIKENPEKEKPEIKFDDEFLDTLFGGREDEKVDKSYTENPTLAETKTTGQSEPFSREPRPATTESKSRDYENGKERPSVRRELKEIEAEQKKEAQDKHEPSKSRGKGKHKTNKRKGVKEHVK